MATLDPQRGLALIRARLNLVQHYLKSLREAKVDNLEISILLGCVDQKQPSDLAITQVINKIGSSFPFQLIGFAAEIPNKKQKEIGYRR